MPKGKKKTVEKQETFEDAMKQLEEIVQGLEGGDLPLEESLKLYEDGVRLTRVCSNRLDEAKKDRSSHAERTERCTVNAR